MSFANSLLALLVTLFALVVDAQTPSPPPPPALRVTPTTQTPWKAHKKISIGLGVGLGLGLVRVPMRCPALCEIFVGLKTQLTLTPSRPVLSPTGPAADHHHRVLLPREARCAGRAGQGR